MLTNMHFKLDVVLLRILQAWIKQWMLQCFNTILSYGLGRFGPWTPWSEKATFPPQNLAKIPLETAEVPPGVPVPLVWNRCCICGKRLALIHCSLCAASPLYSHSPHIVCV